MARFNKLDVPYQWREEFTKYPHGYSIFEAISKWVNRVNDMITNINQWNEYLGVFTSTFGEVPPQMAELQREMEALLSSVNSDLNTITDEVTGLADTLLSHLNDYANQVDVKIVNRVKNVIGANGWQPRTSAYTVTDMGDFYRHEAVNNDVYHYFANSGSINTDINDKIYINLKFKVNGGGNTLPTNIGVGLSNSNKLGVGTYTSQDTIYHAKYILTATSSTFTTVGVFYFFASVVSGHYTDIYKDAISVNLTKTFGAGNEPKKEEMDTLISLIPNGWWDGELKPSQKQLLNWQLKMIRQNRNAIIALGGTII